MAQVIQVAIPDGVGPGEAFLVEFNGTQFDITVPDGCEPGMLIEVEVPGGADEPPAEPTAEASGDPAPQLIEVAIPDGVGPGEAFLVEFDGTQFNITVPDGCEPGMLIQVEVPVIAPEPTATAATDPPAADPPMEQEMSNLKVSDADASTTSTSSHGRPASKSEGSSSQAAASSSYSNPSSSSSSKKSTNYSSNYKYEKYSPFDYDSTYKYESPKWEPEPSVFDGGFVLSGEAAEPCGDFAVGQLVQVTRSDGTWTYGKVLDYDAGGDTYTIHTKAGPKYFVERGDLTDDIVTNPSDGSCAQQ